MKYIIEIEDEPLTRESYEYESANVYRAKGFNSLVFDQNGLDKLTPYEECQKQAEEVYLGGMDDAWDVVRKLIDTEVIKKRNIFDTPFTEEIVKEYEVDEVIKMLKDDGTTFETGDKIVDMNGEEAIVLIPDVGNGKMYVSCKGHLFPQYVFRGGWKKTSFSFSVAHTLNSWKEEK